MVGHDSSWENVRWYKRDTNEVFNWYLKVYHDDGMDYCYVNGRPRVVIRAKGMAFDGYEVA